MTNDEAFAGTTIAQWKLAIKRLNELTSALSDDQLQKEVSPGRNRVYYLIGHLTAVHDRMLPMLFLGDRLHPELDKHFLEEADKTTPDEIASADLRKAFTEVNDKLTAAIEALPAADWLKRHSAVSEEDFAREPLRNRLAVLQSRAGHAMFHAGQIRLTQ
jgi:DinB superfamily